MKAGQQVVSLCWWTPTPPGWARPAAAALGPGSPCIGAALRVDREHGYWKAYIGFGWGPNEQNDAQSIVANGSRLQMEVAMALGAWSHVEGLEHRP